MKSMTKKILQKSNLPDQEMKKIISLYEGKLNIPSKKINPQILICPVGLLGAGKTTVLKPLSKKLSLLRIENDGIRKLLKKEGYDYNRAKEMTFIIAKKYIKKGFSIGLDTNCASKESQYYIKKLVKKYELKDIWLHINPPEKFIINKLRDYKHTWLFKDWHQAIQNYNGTKKQYEKMNFPFLYVFDPSKKGLKSQIDEAIQLIRKTYFISNKKIS